MIRLLLRLVCAVRGHAYYTFRSSDKDWPTIIGCKRCGWRKEEYRGRMG